MLTTHQLLTISTAFVPELRDFSRIWPADATPIAVPEAQEFFYALQVYGVGAGAGRRLPPFGGVQLAPTY